LTEVAQGNGRHRRTESFQTVNCGLTVSEKEKTAAGGKRKTVGGGEVFPKQGHRSSKGHRWRVKILNRGETGRKKDGDQCQKV